MWKNHGDEIQQAGDIFYTWQYELRWAAAKLRNKQVLKGADDSERGMWELRHDR